MSTELELKKSALKIRSAVVAAIAAKGGGHIGGSLDLAELLAVLYDDYMRVDPKNPEWENRDYFVCSKGHAGPALYATLALKGFFPFDWLKTLNQEGSRLPGHCDRMKVPGVDVTSGSLGQGLSIASGLALGVKISETDQHIFCVMGDGETAEGQIWEAAQFASHYQLDNLVAFLDWNKMQIDGSNEAVLKIGDIKAKYEAFGWNACYVNGADVMQIKNAVEHAISDRNGKPSIIILDTIKGQGVECVAAMANNHCVGFGQDLYLKSKEELEKQAEQLGVEIEWLN